MYADARRPFPYRTAPSPDVSILMPVFNAAEHLPMAIASVLAQHTHARWELLIVDDGSSDGSAAVVAHYAAQQPDIHLLFHAGHANRGTSASRNLAMRHARAPLLAFLDADDVWLPHMLAAQLSFLRAHPQAAMVYANAERTWDMSLPCLEREGLRGTNELPPLLPAGTRYGLLSPPHPLDWFLKDEGLVPCTCTVLVSTAIAREIGAFVESFDGLYDDQAFYAKLMLRYPVAANPLCVARYRKHAESCCAQAWHNDDLQQRARRRFEVWLQDHRGARTCQSPANSALVAAR